MEECLRVTESPGVQAAPWCCFAHDTQRAEALLSPCTLHLQDGPGFLYECLVPCRWLHTFSTWSLLFWLMLCSTHAEMPHDFVLQGR